MDMCVSVPVSVYNFPVTYYYLDHLVNRYIYNEIIKPPCIAFIFEILRVQCCTLIKCFGDIHCYIFVVNEQILSPAAVEMCGSSAIDHSTDALSSLL